jgi:FkbM family methyltransferase
MNLKSFSRLAKRNGTWVGVSFAFVCEGGGSEGVPHPSWHTFEDEKEVRERWWQIRKGDVVVDVGAGFGSYTLPALAAGAELVLAWSPESADVLSRSLEENGWSKRAQVLLHALWYRKGFLVIEDGRMPAFYVSHAEAAAHGRGTIVPTSTLDDDLGQLNLARLDWLKVDVGGGEIDVLKGAEGVIKKYQPKILVQNPLHHDREIQKKVEEYLLGLLPHYEAESRPYHAVSHSFFKPMPPAEVKVKVEAKPKAR